MRSDPRRAVMQSHRRSRRSIVCGASADCVRDDTGAVNRRCERRGKRQPTHEQQHQGSLNPWLLQCCRGSQRRAQHPQRGCEGDLEMTRTRERCRAADGMIEERGAQQAPVQRSGDGGRAMSC